MIDNNLDKAYIVAIHTQNIFEYIVHNVCIEFSHDKASKIADRIRCLLSRAKKRTTTRFLFNFNERSYQILQGDFSVEIQEICRLPSLL